AVADTPARASAAAVHAAVPPASRADTPAGMPVPQSDRPVAPAPGRIESAACAPPGSAAHRLPGRGHARAGSGRPAGGQKGQAAPGTPAARPAHVPAPWHPAPGPGSNPEPRPDASAPEPPAGDRIPTGAPRLRA